MTRGRRRAAIAAGVTLAAAVPAMGWLALPPPARFLAPPPSASITLLDRYGRPLRMARAGEDADRRWVSLHEVDPDVIRAFIALEDNRFYDHSGVDARAVLRAARDNLRARRVVSGASTISMQVARMVTGTSRTWLGKTRQAAWALRLEAHLTKQEILEQYLNRVPLGEGTVGVAAAAHRYFAASVARLSLAEAVLLASLARAPTRENPLNDGTRGTRAREAALGTLRARGMITARDSARAASEPLVTPRGAPFDAPYFTTRVLGWMDEAGGAARAGKEAATERSAVITTLDLSLQLALESEVRHTVATLRHVGARHAAVVVLDNPTGGVLAWVGGSDFFDPDHGQVDMVDSPRQPGSALKPFLYGLAFDHGYGPSSVLPDIARTYATVAGTYRPRNYDRRFHGPVRAREALASSHNVPAVELTDRMGPGALLATLQRAGFASLDRSPDHYGLGLALGNGDVALIELANGYRSLVNGGEWRPWAYRLADVPPYRPSTVMSPAAAALVLDVLADPVARIPGFGIETPFDFPFPVAVKTGTSRNFTDNWAIAVTGGFTTAVWVGDVAGRPMQQVSGVTGAGPLLQRAVLRVARRYTPGVLPTPAEAGARQVTVCRVSGAKPGASCPTTTEWLAPGVALDRCDWHRNGRLELPAEYAEWAATTSVAPVASAAPPSGIRIVSPLDGDRYSVPAGVDARYATLPLRAAAAAGEASITWFVDGRPVGGSRWRLEPGSHTVRAVAADGADAEVRIVVD